MKETFFSSGEEPLFSFDVFPNASSNVFPALSTLTQKTGAEVKPGIYKTATAGKGIYIFYKTF